MALDFMLRDALSCLRPRFRNLILFHQRASHQRASHQRASVKVATCVLSLFLLTYPKVKVQCQSSYAQSSYAAISSQDTTTPRPHTGPSDQVQSTGTINSLPADRHGTGSSGEWTNPLDTNIHPTDVVQWQLHSAVRYQNNYLFLLIELTTKDGFALYKEHLSFAAPYGAALEELRAPETIDIRDPITAQLVPVYSRGYFEVIYKIVVPREEFSTPRSLPITYLGCSVRICLFPYTQALSLGEIVESDQAWVPPTQSALRAPRGSPPGSGSSQDGSSLMPLDHSRVNPLSLSNTSAYAPELTGSWEHMLAQKISHQNLPFIWILVICFLGGLLTNLTPCVYPMIPITLRVLSQQSRRPLWGALMYAGGITAIYTALGVFAALSGSMLGGVASSPVFHSIFGAIMVIMALSMLGLKLPSQLFAPLAQLGSRWHLSGNSPANAFVMGTGAGLVGSACTGPVLVALVTYAVSRLSIVESGLLFATYSAGFAAPFLFFGAAITKVSKARVPVPLHLTVKLAMSATILSLAFYFWRIPLHPVLAIISDDQWYVLMIVLLGVGALMGGVVVIRTQWHHRPRMWLAPTLALSLGLFATAQVLQKTSTSALPWVTEVSEIEAVLTHSSSPVLVTMWAQWCTACKVMEATTFRDPKVQAYLSDERFQYVKYDVTAITPQSKELLSSYGIRGLPAYVIILPDDRGGRKVLHGLYEPGHFLTLLSGYVSSPGPKSGPRSVMSH